MSGIVHTGVKVCKMDSEMYRCYNSKTLELVNKKNLILELTQENSIESSLQSSLSYIPIHMVYASYCASYPKVPYIRHEVNI